MLAFETDCWDVHESLKSTNPDFIVVDVRGPSAFGKGHVNGAINIPHREMTATRMAEYPTDKVFVVYCAGPHCNGANKAALRLARLGLPVKTMLGGVTGWIDEGFTLTPRNSRCGHRSPLRRSHCRGSVPRFSQDLRASGHRGGP
jgi:rhodanese-related sulfurtransferase